jgi:hypothetical protein
MKMTINKKVYDTDLSESLGCKYVGEFGQPDGYEERLFKAECGQHFIYGVGGSESKYSEASIELVTVVQANEWLKVNTEG